jgi:transposase-like protein
MSQFTNTSAAIIEAVQAGASIEETARTNDVPVATVRRWLREGRAGKSPYADFAAAVDGARDERKQAERELTEGPLTPEEAELLLARAARKGSVPALRLYYERQAADNASERGASARKLLSQVFGDDGR